MRGYALRAADRAGVVAGAVAGLATALAVLLAGVALIGVGVAGTGGAVVAIGVAAVAVAVIWACCGRLALSAMLARPVGEVEHPELYRLARELSKAGRVPVPRLYLSPAEQPNAFAVGRNSRTAAICCTQGLLKTLDEDELRAVLAYELAYLSGPDLLASSVSAGLAAVIVFPASLARFLRPPRTALGGPGLGALESALLLVLGPIAAVIIRLAVSRERVYRADATAALAAGDALELAAALRTIEVGAMGLALAPDGRRLAAGHLMIVSPFGLAGVARLFDTHPPAGERIRRLEALAGYRR